MWILMMSLIVSSNAGKGAAVATAEFDNEHACMVAAHKWEVQFDESWRTLAKTICVPKN